MKWVFRVVLGLVAVALVAIVALAFLVPRLLDQPEVRARIAEGAREVTGRELTWGALDVAFMPPGFEVTEAVLEPAAEEAPLAARRIALRVALLPLLGGVVAIDSLEIEGADLEIVRGADGIELPVRRPETSGEEAAPSRGSDQGAAPDSVDGGEEDPIALAVRRVRLSDSRIVVIDRTTTPPARLALNGLDLTARGKPDPEAPIAFEASASFESGGKLELSGEASLDGAWSLQAELAGLGLAPFGAWVENVALLGQADIRMDATGSNGTPSGLTLEIEAQALELTREDLFVSGTIPVALTAAWLESGRVAGPLEIDLTQVAVRLGDQLDKPVGDALAVTGKLGWDGADGLELGAAHVTLPGVIVTGDFQVLPELAARLSAPGFDPAPLASWFPALADAPVEGRIGLEDWTLSLDPMRLGGAVHLEGVRVPLEAGHVAEVSGMLEGAGDAVDGTGLQVRVAEQLLTVSLRVSGLGTAPAARVEVEGTGLDSAALLAAIGGPDESLSGPLDLRALIEAPLDSDREFSQVVRGRAQFQVAPGRLRGVSLLRSTFDAFGSVGSVALLAGQTFGGSTLQKFYGEDFERLSGSALLANGVARTNDLRLDYRHYSADLAGAYHLADDRIDMTGQITLYEEIDRALAESTPGAVLDPTARAVDKTIPLAHVSGTLDDPKVRVTSATVAAFARSYLDRRNRVGRLQDEVDERLGEGSGKAVFDVLEGILGGKPR